ncbi:hypothetical protein KJ652_00170 [Patescibacteria group bacterium]|nr:hypothetical protein [Patescibacteria group bacterium]MBU1122988.1 hypothetical protein [Patescibacteria group bacterium]MBU1911672.1 hypothetical protein [Patescibacteria group bacterium]
MLKPARRLPKRYNRPVMRETKRLLRRRHKQKRSQHWKEIFNRFRRRGQRVVKAWAKSCMWWLLTIFVALLLLFVGLLLFSPLLEIREARVTRVNARLDIEEVQRILAPYFGRHLFFLPTYEVSRTIKGSFTDVKEVKVGKDYPFGLSVHIELDPIYARLAILDPDEMGFTTQTGATIDFLTDQGAYVIAPLSKAGEKLPLIRLVDWGVRPTEGDEMLSSDFLNRISETERALSEQFGHTIEGRTVFLRAQEFHLHLKRGIEIWFDIVTPMEEQLLKYRTFLRSIDLNEVENYVDLRMSDRVVYK